MYPILKFDIIIYKINSEIVKSERVVLTEREKYNIANADINMA
jgi:hypothetical protein